jgi:hypothetical protein
VETLIADGAGNLIAADWGRSLSRWDGTNWSRIGSGTDDGINALALDSAGHLFVGGFFTTAGNTFSPYLVQANLTGSGTIAPTVRETTFSEVTATSATLGGTLTHDGNTPVTTSGLLYALTSENPQPEVGEPGVTMLTSSGSTSFFFLTANAAGLTSGVEYSVRAFATNSAGTSYSSTRHFTTLNNDATLSGLLVDTATLSPGFGATTTSYQTEILFGTTSLTIRPTASSAGATIRVNNVPVTSAGLGRLIALNEGANAITVSVKAQDALTTKVYDITATRLGQLASWRKVWYGTSSSTGDASDSADPHGTGVPNLAAYAFFGPNQNPAQLQPRSLPQPEVSEGYLTLRFTEPSGISGVTYGAEASSSLQADSWQPVTDSGVAPEHIFRVPLTGDSKVFLRLTVTTP